MSGKKVQRTIYFGVSAAQKGKNAEKNGKGEVEEDQGRRNEKRQGGQKISKRHIVIILN